MYPFITGLAWVFGLLSILVILVKILGCCQWVYECNEAGKHRLADQIIAKYIDALVRPVVILIVCGMWLIFGSWNGS